MTNNSPRRCSLPPMASACAALFAALLATALLGAAPLSSAATTEPRKQPTTLRVAISQGIDSLNPFLAAFLSSTAVLRLNYEYLTAYDAKDYHPIGGLAESWETSPDKLTWTYRMRDAKWSDGQPITARDAAFTFNLMMRDEEARTANGNFVANFSSVNAKDDKTLVITTKTPQATMLALDVPIVPEHVWKNVKDIGDFTNDRLPLVGSGPFILTEHATDRFIRLKANRNYFRGPPEVDELVFQYYKNTDAAVQALRRGEVDLVGRLTAAQFEALKGDKSIALNKGQGRRFYELATNAGAATKDGKPIGDGHPALQDARVRQALAHAMDSKTLVDKVLRGYGQVGGGYIPPIFTEFHWDPSEAEEFRFDIARANQILDEAGYSRGANGVRTMPDGSRPLKFRLYGQTEGPNDALVTQYIKGWLRQIGIDVDVQMMSSTRANDLWMAGKFDLAVGAWSANPDPDFILSIQTCNARPDAGGKGGTPDTFFCDPEYDRLYQQQLAEFDRAKRADLVKQAQRRFHEQAPGIILYYENTLEAYRKDRFAGFQVQPDPGGMIVFQQGVWGLYSAKPVSDEGPAGGDAALIAVGGITAAVAGAAGVLFVMRRRRGTAEERE